MKIGVLILLFLTAAAGQSPGTFTATGNLTTNRLFPRATLLPNGKVLITGSGSQVSGAELYDPFTGKFTATGNTRSWASHSSTLLADGSVLLAGGYGSNGAPSAELYNPATGTFTPTGEMTTARLGQGTLLKDGRVLFLGGEAAPPWPAELTGELYDPATGKFTALGTFAGIGQFVSTATLLADGRVLILGRGAGLYDPGSGTFSPTGTPTGWDGSAILLTNGKVLFTGGIDDNGEDIHAELYDPGTGVFAPTGSMTTPRVDHSATLLADGTVLLAGSQRSEGDGAGRGFASAELYDPVTGTSSATGDMITPRFGQAAVLLPDGTVLIAGGGANGIGEPGARAELYHPFVLKPAPVLLSLAQGQGAILHAGTLRVVSAADPAIAGEALEIYCTGLIDGSVIPPQVSIGGRMAEILFFGNTPGYAGLNQINVRVPAGVAPGPAVAVRLIYIGRPSNAVTIGAK
jgi:galactose oxidase-like protein